MAGSQPRARTGRIAAQGARPMRRPNLPVATPMYSSQVYYLPLSPPFFSFLAFVFLALVVLLLIGTLRYVYTRLGMSSGAALLLLLASLVGSYVNIPVAQLPERDVMSGQEITYFGMHYIVPQVLEWPGTIIAVNVGGAVIPVVLSLYLLARNRLWIRGLVAIACVSAVCHVLADPVPGVGIAVPVFVPPASAAVVALLLSRRFAGPLAYVGGSLGTLIGADLLNLDKVRDSARRWPRSVGPARSTGFSSPESSPCCSPACPAGCWGSAPRQKQAPARYEGWYARRMTPVFSRVGWTHRVRRR
jgi:uncharacterized membrane protein